MKNLLLLLLCFPLQSFPCFLQCLNPWYRKRVQEDEHRVYFNRINRGNDTYHISISAINNDHEEHKELPFPKSWPIIEQIVNHYDLDTKEWQLVITSDSNNCIAIVPIAHKSNTFRGKSILGYRWVVKPLATGIAQLKAEYVSKDKSDPVIYTERTFTIYIQ